MTAASFDEHIARLRARLAGRLPGTAAQFTMAPVYRQDARLADVRDKRCREAGVLALLFPLDDAPAVLLTIRRAHLNDHAGQISFPGGRREPGEDLRATALREAHEELGLAPESVEVLGALTPLYIPPSNFCVYPYVGVTTRAPDLRPHDEEVAEVLAVPLARLTAPGVRRREPWTLRGRTVEVPFFDLDGHKVWGATAMMLAELLALVEDTAETPPNTRGNAGA
ncbi:NUDIX hydrolase [Rhodocaloribacter sp.]